MGSDPYLRTGWLGGLETGKIIDIEFSNLPWITGMNSKDALRKLELDIGLIDFIPVNYLSASSEGLDCLLV